LQKPSWLYFLLGCKHTSSSLHVNQFHLKSLYLSTRRHVQADLLVVTDMRELNPRAREPGTLRDYVCAKLSGCHDRRDMCLVNKCQWLALSRLQVPWINFTEDRRRDNGS
jgi:hypothetical protein